MGQTTDAPSRLLELTFVVGCTFLLVGFNFTELEPSRKSLLATRELGCVPVCDIGKAEFSRPSISGSDTEKCK